MGLFGRRKPRIEQPQHSPEFLARHAEMLRINDAEPQVRAVDIHDLGEAFIPPMQEALRIADMPTIDSLYAALDGDEERHMWLHAARDFDSPNLIAVIERAQKHGSATSVMLASNMALNLARKLRGEEPIDEVDEEDLRGHETWLARARELMDEAIRLNSADPYAYILAQGATAVGGPQAVLEHAKQWQALDPWNPMGWGDMIRALDPRLSGDPELLPQIAVHLAEHAPEGHPALAEAVVALDQHWDYLRQYQRLSPDEADRAVWRSEHGLHVITTAFERFADKYQVGLLAPRHWDQFTFAFAMAGLYEEALTLMRQQQGLIVRGRWSSRFASPEGAYISRRWKAIQATYRRQHPLPEDADDRDIDWGPRGRPTA